MLKKILIVLGALVALFLVGGLLMSSDFKVTRKVTIQADVARGHEMCGELRNWDKWAPWKEQDPTIVTTYGATTTGVGASQTWTGKDGAGELTFTRCDPQQGIAYDMAFINGEQRMPAQSWMNYTASSGAVEVEWGMTGEMDMPIIGPYFAMMSDSMIGPMFQTGLAKLKSVCEAK